jgi:pseudouridine kinase
LINRDGHVLVIGSSGIDLVGRAEQALQRGTSNPGWLRYSHGGVARNVAENLARLGTDSVLISAVGNDPQGQQLVEHLSGAGVDTSHVVTVDDHPTGTYLAILDEDGSLHVGMDDMGAASAITVEHLRQRKHLFSEASVVFVDANLPKKTLAAAVSLAKGAKVPLAADPTSTTLAGNLNSHLASIWLLTPNEAEADTLCPHPVPHADLSSASTAARYLISQGVEIVIITMAEFGVTYATADRSGHIPAVRTVIQDPTGAGDALSAAVIFALLNDIPMDEAVKLGASAAAIALRSAGTVEPNLSLEMLYAQL